MFLAPLCPPPPPEELTNFDKYAHLIPPLDARAPRWKTIHGSLKVSPSAMKEIEERVKAQKFTRKRWGTTMGQQDIAIDFLLSLGAHIPEEIIRDARSKLSIRRSDVGDPIKSKARASVNFLRKRRVVQCICGSDHSVGHNASEKRDMPWKNVGCQFYFDLTTTHTADDSQELLTVDEIVGHLSHSPECLALDTMDKSPRIPLEPRLRDYLLVELESGVPLAKIKEKARIWATKNLGGGAGNGSHRFILNTGDMSSLYRTQARMRGILRQPPEHNLDLWFRSVNPQPPDPRLSLACLSYKPHIAGKTERLSMIFSTPEQQALAWRYGHKRHMLVDLTFGFCSGRLLLLVLMALDDNGRGIPVSLIIFSAKQHTKAVHSDYNTTLLTDVIREYKEAMGRNAAGEAFEVTVGTTDNDTRERNALRAIFPGILLLLCMFHVWQAWRNALNRFLRIISDADNRKTTRQRLAGFAYRLLKNTSVYADAIAAYNTEIRYFEGIGRRRTSSAKQISKGALAFLTYFQSYVKEKELWVSWSPAGAILAAEKLGIPVERVARTTNALESWNGRAKGQYITHHQHSGRLLRPDHWVYVMVLFAIPAMLADWLQKRQRESFYSSMQTSAPAPIAPKLRSRQANIPSEPSPELLRPPVADLAPPRTRDEALARAQLWIDQATTLPPPPPKEPRSLTLEEMVEEPTEEENAAMGDVDEEEIEKLAADATMLEGDVADASFTPSSAASSLPSEFSFFSDVALDREDIVVDMDSSDLDVPETDCSDDDSFSLANLQQLRRSLPSTPEKQQSSSSPRGTRRTSPAASSPTSATDIATATMELNLAEDMLVGALKRLMDLGKSPEELREHMSAAVARRMDGRGPERLALPLPWPTPTTSPSGRVALSPAVPLPVAEDGGDASLVPIAPQLKHRRYTSHGIR
ncbi:hypothetical protein MKEN_01161400 [Mycena kentingensis (nom. inval.)]|nr:hypothetical protein MKEN_01161400 [Mycena kentingensis (nom. inval.)]